MMNIWDADKLVLFVAFAIPGFIALKAYELMFPGIREDPGNQIVDAVAYSCINYALLIWPVVAVEALGWRAGHPVLYGVFWLFVLFVAPVLWSFLWGLTRTRKFFQRALIHPIQKPWDFLFAQRKAFWVKIVLNDGTKIGGKYADRSFASSAPAEEQIYLEESWILNDKGGFERPKNRTAGILVLASQIAYLEFYCVEVDANE